MTPPRKKYQSSQAHLWMFLASAFSFMLATTYEGIFLVTGGIVIHTELVEYGDRPLVDTLLLAHQQLLKPNTGVFWISYLVVRVQDIHLLRILH
jgi:hypothetical protein